jgi:hypothetical protein
VASYILDEAYAVSAATIYRPTSPAVHARQKEALQKIIPTRFAMPPAAIKLPSHGPPIIAAHCGNPWSFKTARSMPLDCAINMDMKYTQKMIRNTITLLSRMTPPVYPLLQRTSSRYPIQ